jgi:hypothetical protein
MLVSPLSLKGTVGESQGAFQKMTIYYNVHRALSIIKSHNTQSNTMHSIVFSYSILQYTNYNILLTNPVEIYRID